MAPTRSALWAASLFVLSTGITALPGDPAGYTAGHEEPHPAYDDHPGKPHPLSPAHLPIPYLGCYIHTDEPYALPLHHAESPVLTPAKCHAHCQNHGTTYSGVSHGNKCSCSNHPPTTKPAPEHECSLPCSGDPNTACGGKNRIHVWGAPLPVREQVGPYKYQGCFTDSRDTKSLTGKVTRDAEMTLEKCASECKEYAFFGTEYGTQCFCGTELEVYARRKPQYECAQRCGGDPNEICGDADRLSVYSKGEMSPIKNPEVVGGFKLKGCWSDSVAERSLEGKVLRDGEMTVELCAKFCKGSKYMGLEFGSQCFCGDHLGGHAVGKDECSYLCEGNKKEVCGGSARLSLYEVEKEEKKCGEGNYGKREECEGEY